MKITFLKKFLLVQLILLGSNASFANDFNFNDTANFRLETNQNNSRTLASVQEDLTTTKSNEKENKVKSQKELFEFQPTYWKFKEFENSSESN